MLITLSYRLPSARTAEVLGAVTAYPLGKLLQGK